MPQKTSKAALGKVINSVIEPNNIPKQTASIKDKSKPVSSMATTAVDHATTEPEDSDSEQEDTSNASGSDVFNDSDYEYDSDGQMIFDPSTPHSPKSPTPTSTNKNKIDPSTFEITPAHVERFIASLPVIAFGDLGHKDQKCGVCKSRYQILGQTNEVVVQMSCGHFVGRRCLGNVLGKGEGGKRECPICGGLLPVWSA